MLHADNEEVVFKRVIFVLFFGKVLVVGARFSGESKLPPQVCNPRERYACLKLPCFPRIDERRRLTCTSQPLDSGQTAEFCLGCAVVKLCHRESFFACILRAISGGDI